MTREEAITYLEDAKSDLPYKFGQALDMAISALKTPTAADAICAIRKQINFTRDRIKDGHDGEFEHGIIRGCQYSIRLIREIKALPSSEAAQGWIPVSERLPIPPAFCLVTTDGSHGDVIDIALYMSDGWHKASDVLAWMPLPEPYRGEGEEHETD